MSRRRRQEDANVRCARGVRLPCINNASHAYPRIASCACRHVGTRSSQDRARVSEAPELVKLLDAAIEHGWSIARHTVDLLQAGGESSTLLLERAVARPVLVSPDLSRSAHRVIILEPVPNVTVTAYSKGRFEKRVLLCVLQSQRWPVALRPRKIREEARMVPLLCLSIEHEYVIHEPRCAEAPRPDAAAPP